MSLLNIPELKKKFKQFNLIDINDFNSMRKHQEAKTTYRFAQSTEEKIQQLQPEQQQQQQQQLSQPSQVQQSSTLQTQQQPQQQETIQPQQQDLSASNNNRQIQQIIPSIPDDNQLPNQNNNNIPFDTPTAATATTGGSILPSNQPNIPQESIVPSNQNASQPQESESNTNQNRQQQYPNNNSRYPNNNNNFNNNRYSNNNNNNQDAPPQPVIIPQISSKIHDTLSLHSYFDLILLIAAKEILLFHPEQLSNSLTVHKLSNDEGLSFGKVFILNDYYIAVVIYDTNNSTQSYGICIITPTELFEQLNGGGKKQGDNQSIPENTASSHLFSVQLLLGLESSSITDVDVDIDMEMLFWCSAAGNLHCMSLSLDYVMLYEDEEVKEITSVLADCQSDKVLYGTVAGVIKMVDMNSKTAEIAVRLPSQINSMSFQQFKQMGKSNNSSSSGRMLLVMNNEISSGQVSLYAYPSFKQIQGCKTISQSNIQIQQRKLSATNPADQSSSSLLIGISNASTNEFQAIVCSADGFQVIYSKTFAQSISSYVMAEYLPLSLLKIYYPNRNTVPADQSQNDLCRYCIDNCSSQSKQ